MRTYGARYAKGPEYLRRLAELQATIAAARADAGQSADLERWHGAVQQFESLRTEALLANPLLDFDRLLLVKRADAGQKTPRPRVRGEAGNFVGNDTVGFLNGLPINFQGNGYLREIAFDNEIAVLSPVRPGGTAHDALPPREARLRRRSEARLRRGSVAVLVGRQSRALADLRDRRRRQEPPPGDARRGRRRRQLRLLLPARRPDPVRLVRLFPVGAVRAAVRRGGQLLRHERRRLGGPAAVLRPGSQFLSLGDGRRPHPLHALGVHRHRPRLHRAADDDEPRRDRAAGPLRQRQFLAQPHLLRPAHPRPPDQVRGHHHRASRDGAGGRTGGVRRGQGPAPGRGGRAADPRPGQDRRSEDGGQPGRCLLAEVPPSLSAQRQVLPRVLPADAASRDGASTWSTCSTTCSCCARKRAACCSSRFRCAKRRARR